MTWDADEDSPVAPLSLPQALSGAAVGVGDGEGREETGGLLCIPGHGFITAFFHPVPVCCLLVRRDRCGGDNDGADEGGGYEGMKVFQRLEGNCNVFYQQDRIAKSR